MDIGKLAVPKAGEQHQKVEGTRSKHGSGKVAARHGEGAHGASHTDSVQISGSARNMGNVVQSYVSQLEQMDSTSQLDAASIQSYRDRLASGALTTPAVLESTASIILDGIDSEI